MSIRNFNEVLAVETVRGMPRSAATGSAGQIVPDECKILLPNHYLKVGKVLRMNWWGEMSQEVTGAAGLWQFFINLGASGTANTCNMASVTNNSVAKYSVPFHAFFIGVVRTFGTSTTGTMWFISRMHSETVVGSPLTTVGGSGALCCPNGVTAVSSGFDSTIQNYLVPALVGGSLINFSFINRFYVLEALN